jgi:hypothetical protein
MTIPSNGTLSTSNYSLVGQIGSGPVPQAITFNAPAPGTVGGQASLSATGGASGNPVVFSVDPTSGAGVCNLTGTNGSIVHYTAAGTCVIDANQAGNVSYLAAPQVQRSVTVSKVNQTITFNLPVLWFRFLSPVSIASTASASSKLPVTFTTTTPAVCTSSGTNGATIKLLKSGTCTVQANQAGNATYNAAPTVTRSSFII